MAPNTAIARSSNGSRASTPASKDNVEKLLRLVGFSFGRKKYLFAPAHRERVHRALGAITTRGRIGQQPTVIRRVTTIYRTSIHTHHLYPSFDIESARFWQAVLSDVRKEIPQISEELDIRALINIISTYTQGYADAHEEEMIKEAEKDDIASDEDDTFDVSKPFQASTDPRKILQPLVRAWARIFRKRQLSKPATADIPSETTKKPATPYPVQQPGEANTSYIRRLQETISAHVKEISSIKRAQEASDTHNQNLTDRLCASLDRSDTHLRQARLDADGGEDSPWVHYKDYANELGIESGTTDDEEGDQDWVEDGQDSDDDP